MSIVKVNDSTYHMNDSLIKNWNKIKDGRLSMIDEDRVYIVDGRERTGKSLFTIQQAAYIDKTILEDEKNGKILPKISLEGVKSWEHPSEWRREMIKRFKEGSLLPRITFNSKETLTAIRKTKSNDKETKAIIFDEAFRGMSSKGVLSKENKILVQTLMEMGQSNLVLWIVSPSFYLLELYPAILRSNALFHIKKDKQGKKRVVRIFNFKQKASLYQIGLRKGWGYPIHSRHAANFYNIYPDKREFEWRYRLKKQLSLRDNEKKEVKEEHIWKKQRDLMIKGLYSEKKSTRKLSLILKGWGITLSKDQISFLVREKENQDNLNEENLDIEVENQEVNEEMSEVPEKSSDNL